MFGNKTNCSQRNVASELTGKYTDSGNYVDTAVVKLEESFAIAGRTWLRQGHVVIILK